MVNGIEKFREKFEKFDDGYVVIGGTACSLIMESEKISFRSTKDIDAVLIVGASDFPAFAEEFWNFIKEGGYTCGWKGEDKPHYFRFTQPRNGYPEKIELFSESIDSFQIPQGITPVYVSDEVSSLSAIVMDEDYCRLLDNGCTKINGIRVLRPEYLIVFKMYARINLAEDKTNGKHVNEGDFKKHKNDVFRLLQLLPADMRVDLPEKIKGHVHRFVDSMKDEFLDYQVLGVLESKNEALEMIKTVYQVVNS